MYFAHKTENGEKQPLIEHLKNTADRARSNSFESLSEFAYICRLFHDIEKYSIEFQRRLDGENIHTEHSLGEAIKTTGLYLQDNWIYNKDMISDLQKLY